MSLIPPPEGFHEAPRNPDGTVRDTRTPQQRKAAQEKILTERKAKMERYEARTREAQEKLLKAAKGLTDKIEPPAPKDEFDFVLMGILADPATLDQKGSGHLQVLTPEQRRARARARMDEQAVDARQALDKAIKGDQDEDPYDFTGLSRDEAESLIECDDDDDDDDLSFLDDVSLNMEDD